MKRPFKLVHSVDGSLYIVDMRTKNLIDFENVHANMKDINKALTLCNGCSLDDPYDCNRVLQTILDIIGEKLDTTEA